MYMFESPLSRSRSALERKLTLITKMSISNYSTINRVHDSYLRLWHSWQNRWKYWASSPKLSPTGEMRKISTRRIPCEPSDPNWVRVQRRAFKTKTLNVSFTTHIHTYLNSSFRGTNRASKSQNCVQIWGRKTPARNAAWALEPRFSPIAEMSISNGSPNQALQVGHAHLRFSRWEHRTFNPKFQYTDRDDKMSTRNTEWAIEPKLGRIIAAHKHQTRAFNKSFTTKVHTCSSAARQRSFSASEAFPAASIVFLCAFSS
jgi:hypothetical protein